MILLVALSALLAQAFDAASVKPRPAGPGTMNRETPGRIDYVGIPLMVVIARTYNVDSFQVAAPDWVYSDGYEIRATFPANTPPEQFRIMLQALLADRFHLTVHHEQRQLSAYVLTVAKGGLKMKAHPDARPNYKTPADAAARHVIGTISMPILAGYLSYIVNAPVADQTAIEGTYDIGLDFFTDTAVDAPSIYSALQDQLGLKLESKKAPLDVVVVHRIDKTPGKLTPQRVAGSQRIRPVRTIRRGGLFEAACQSYSRAMNETRQPPPLRSRIA